MKKNSMLFISFLTLGFIISSTHAMEHGDGKSLTKNKNTCEILNVHLEEMYEMAYKQFAEKKYAAAGKNFRIISQNPYVSKELKYKADTHLLYLGIILLNEIINSSITPEQKKYSLEKLKLFIQQLSFSVEQDSGKFVMQRELLKSIEEKNIEFATFNQIKNILNNNSLYNDFSIQQALNDLVQLIQNPNTFTSLELKDIQEIASLIIRYFQYIPKGPYLIPYLNIAQAQQITKSYNKREII